MERDKILKLARKEIFEKMHKFNYINNIEVIDDVKEDSNLSSDLAMDPFDLFDLNIFDDDYPGDTSLV